MPHQQRFAENRTILINSTKMNILLHIIDSRGRVIMAAMPCTLVMARRLMSFDLWAWPMLWGKSSALICIGSENFKL